MDDDADIRELIISQLERDAFVVTAAGSAGEAMVALAREPADVLVLDLNLPDGDGLALCRDRRARDYAKAIIMVTARDSTLGCVPGLELGADDYLTKPFELRRDGAGGLPCRVRRNRDHRGRRGSRHSARADRRHVRGLCKGRCQPFANLGRHRPGLTIAGAQASSFGATIALDNRARGGLIATLTFAACEPA